MPRDRAATADISLTNRSAVTNGSRAYVERFDGRTPYGRYQRDLERAFADEIGGDLTIGQRLKVRQAAALATRAEQLRAAIARGDDSISDDDLIRVANAMRRELADLGLDKPARVDRADDLASEMAARRAALRGGVAA